MKEIEVFITNVKSLCYLKKIKLGDLEKELGVGKGYLARVARGSGDLSLRNALMLSKRLDKSMDDLLTANYAAVVAKQALDEKINKARQELEKLEAERRELE